MRYLNIVFSCLILAAGCAENTAESPQSGNNAMSGSTSNADATPPDTQAPDGSTEDADDPGSDTGIMQSDQDYCSAYVGQSNAYFCEDFTNTSPLALIGSIPPMSFRDQTFREYTRGEIFSLPDPQTESLQQHVLNLHTDTVDGTDFSQYAEITREVARHWDITAHSRDGYAEPGTGPGFNDEYWWNENQFMGDHGARCGRPVDLDAFTDTQRNGERAFTFMQQFFALPDSWSGDELALNSFWQPQRELDLLDGAGIHHIVRYEDMIYLCGDHLMTSAYASGAAKLSLTPDHLLDTSAGEAVVEFSVSTYRTAGRDYWQLDLSPLTTHLQLPEGDVVADANGKVFNGFAINTELNDGMTGPADLLGGINVFRTMMVKGDQFKDEMGYFAPDDPDARFVRAQIANPGDAERLALYQQAPVGADWVLQHSHYNQVMYDYLDGDNNPDVDLHTVTSNRQRTRFRLTILKSPTAAGWSERPDLWDQVALCLPDYGNRCIGEYVVPELPVELVVQFTHYAYNTTKSCAAGGEQPHDIGGPLAVFQSTCHANTYHWDNFYLSPTRPFNIIKAAKRTDKANGNNNEIIRLMFEEPAPARSKLRFNALTAGTGNDAAGTTTLEVSFDQGLTWHRPQQQPEPTNNFDKFRSYYTGAGDSEFIPVGVQEVLFRADNPSFRDAYWIRDASFWSFPTD